MIFQSESKLKTKQTQSREIKLGRRQDNSLSRKRGLSFADYLNGSVSKDKTANGYQVERFRRQKEENLRLMKKLSEIGRRKSMFDLINDN